MWSDTVALFGDYMGTGLTMIWFILSLAYLWVNEKEQHIRILFLYLPIILLLLYFNPLFAALVYEVIGEEVYYRLLWMLPVTVVIAYTCVSICGRIVETYQNAPQSGKRQNLKKYLTGGAAAAVMAGVIAVCGSYIYHDPNYVKAQNAYHVPDSVVYICDTIEVPGREVMAVFPLELVQYVRQYSPYVCMPYGRERLVDRPNWKNESPLCDMMEADEVDLEQLVPLTREAGCHFCILRADKVILGNVEDYGWVKAGETEGFIIYRDTEVELIIPDPD